MYCLWEKASRLCTYNTNVAFVMSYNYAIQIFIFIILIIFILDTSTVKLKNLYFNTTKKKYIVIIRDRCPYINYKLYLLLLLVN